MDINLLIWSFLIIFMIHNFEEIITIEKWFQKTYPNICERFPAVARKVIEKMKVTSAATFSIAVCVLFIVASALVIITIITEQYFLFIGLNIFFALNIITHPVQSLFLRTYVPGVLTTFILIIPYNVILFNELITLGLMDFSTIGRALIVTILFIPMLLISHKIAEKWNKKQKILFLIVGKAPSTDKFRLILKRRFTMLTIQDHLERKITLPHPPNRIISLVPAITETMYHLGLEDQIVGRTRFCIHPKDKVKQAINIGGTKEIKLDRIHELKPDLIIAEKEENTKEIVETLEQHYPVFVFEVKKITDVYRMITDVGKLTIRESESTKLVENIQSEFVKLPNVNGKRAAYVIWKKPYMVVGKDTYIQSLLDKMGFINPFTKMEGRYPTVTEEDFHKAELDCILLATEPYPFREKHLEEFQAMLPDVNPIIVDGEMFWYGVRMTQAAGYFREIFSK